MFREVSKKRLAELEEETLAFWEEEGVFEQSLENRKEGLPFTIYDGPPFATGLPHYGHLLAGTIKDVIPRYKTMKGFFVPRRFGWDCHGIPIEHEIEKKLGLSGAADIEAFGVAKFNDECASIVQRYTTEWKKTVSRMGRFVDFDRTWKTMDLPFMESVWWAFKTLWDREFVYEGFRVMPYSAKLGTPLSNFEAGENYRNVEDPSLTVQLPLEEEPEVSLLVWTTTPWTLVSNMAAMVGEDITYVKARHHESGQVVILAEERLFTYGDFDIIEHIKGSDLVGKSYKAPFEYFGKTHTVIAGDEVSTDDGTGIVHSAPAFGEADFYACKRAGIELVCPVDDNGQFTGEIPEYTGLFVKDADKDIIKRLKAAGRVFHHATIRHRYPYCPRSDTPLIYKAVSTWFIHVEKIRNKLLNANEKVHWTPHHLKHGRFGKWLEQARDWNIARSRFWGTPIPIWRSQDGEMIVMGSIDELEKLTGTKIDDLHRHHIDHLTFEKDGKLYKRIPEVFDCWFESGSMPYARNHYPFSNDTIDHPADFIAEGLDQTRGWFYTLTVLSTILFNEPAFKNIIVNGIILNEKGVKMSKRLRNYPPVEDVIHKHGADAVRLYMLHSPAVRADDLRFSEKGVEQVSRQILLPLWNAYTFFVTYARIYKWTPTERPDQLHNLDRWILSRLQKLVQDVESGLDDYDLSRAVEPFVGFIDELTNWYIRLSRRRFWEEITSSYWTLFTTLTTLARITAPFIPFLSDTIYRALTGPTSVHLADFPTYDPSLRDENLEGQMDAVQTVTRLGHQLRKTHRVKVRQPLAKVHIASANPAILEALKEQSPLIASELNVKDVALTDDETQFVKLTPKPNFRILGKKVGKLMRAVQAAIGAFDQSQLATLQGGNDLTITIENEEITLTPDDVEVERSVLEGMEAANHDEITVILDTTLTDDLLIEGLARELVNKVSTMRKEAGLEYTDRITLILDTTDRIKQAVDTHHDYISHELLATSITFAAGDGQEWDLNGELCTINLQRS